MDFESPDVMKDFPGLYSSDAHKTKGTDTDFSDDVEKVTKKDALIGKRKDKKDKKDKERGYAALEGESSAEESCEVRSPSKSKKSKSFKFPTKSKEKREKSRDKEKEVEKRSKDKKVDKKVEKDKSKCDKKDKKIKYDECVDIADVLPIFGVPLKLAVVRGHCHDGINLPLPLRACIDHIERCGLTFEGVYKINAPKSKVSHLKKLYNQRELVDLSEYDIPTTTALFKMFLRDMGEPIFTTELLIRFEEAGAILNVGVREKHLKILVSNLPEHNRLALLWIIVHLYNVTLNEKYNKMNAQSVALCLNSTLQTSHRLLTALLCHCPALFPDATLKPYIPPLTSGSQLPDDPILMEEELQKQESLLSLIHEEMNTGIVIKKREELLWEVQRLITQLKRKLKTVNKDKEVVVDKVDETTNVKEEVVESETTSSCEVVAENERPLEVEEELDRSKSLDEIDTVCDADTDAATVGETTVSNASSINSCGKEEQCDSDCGVVNVDNGNDPDKELVKVELKNTLLNDLKNSFLLRIENEKTDIVNLKNQISNKSNLMPISNNTSSVKLDEIMDLLHKENQILQIKKISLVRQIMEQLEACIDLKTKLDAL